MTVYKCDDYVLDTGNSAKSYLYYKEQLLFMGDSRTAIKVFCKNCRDITLLAKLKKYTYINI